MTQAGAGQAELTAVVERARRRVILNRALSEAGVAATVTLLGPTLFLLLGKAWFGWPALAALPLAGVAVAVWRLRRARPDLYRVSQVLDARAAGKDQISTAVYFLSSEERPAVEQRRAAAKLAERIDVESAFPFGMPRSVYALASVFVVASALCALRFFLEKPLRVEQPLPQLVLEAMGGAPWQKTARRQDGLDQTRQPAPKLAEALALESQGRAGEQGQQAGRESPDPNANGFPDSGDKARTRDGEKDGRGQNQNAQTGDEFGDAMASSADNDAMQSYEDMLERDAKSGLSKAEGNQAKDSNGSEDRRGSDASNSLLAKLRDAMNNMLSRLQQKAPGSNQQQSAGAASNGGDEQKDGGGEGRSGAGQPKAGGQDGADGEGTESGSQDQSAQNSSGQGGKTSDQGSRGSTGDGAGKQEGDKRILDAQQQEAMGKLSELYGKRAANVTGEITIETQGGKQTLRTPQGQSQARHADSGGEVSRDEIPLAYQAYVKEYFNKLRQTNKK